MLLDPNGQRRPSNLTELLFGDARSGYYLLRDNNLKCYVKCNEILRVFSKILKPLLRSYELLKSQYEELAAVEEVKNAIRYSKNLIEGIEAICMFGTQGELEMQGKMVE